MSLRFWVHNDKIVLRFEVSIIMEKTIKKYFDCWINKNMEPLVEIFSDNIIYSECYGPEYRGINEILRWFKEWNEQGTVLKWDIKQILCCNKTIIVEWYFECSYDNAFSGFDGVTIADFDENNKITNLKEFQSKSEHYYPYH